MNRVKRAIIMAAGNGSRLHPVTLTTPKPLISVLGRRMIDTIIDALYANGIDEIHVVVGYLKEHFECLKDKYPNLDFIENPYYSTCNNISSLYMAREYLCDVMILDGDQLINDVSALSPEFERSGYNAVWTDGHTNEWLMTVNEEGVVTSCSRNGGEGGFALYSVSRWSAEDGAKLRRYLETEFIEKENTQIYWDDVAMFCHSEDFELGIREMKYGDVVEIDTYDELVELDASYKK